MIGIALVMSGCPRPSTVETISHRRRNPFGMSPECHGGQAVPGYGDPSADFHLIGDHPGRHGGVRTGVPFTAHPVGRRLQGLLHELGLLGSPYDEEPDVSNLFMSYLHMCPPLHDEAPTVESYARLERFFDAELRAVNAHILLPVGRRATDVVLESYTTQARKVPAAMEDRHAIEVRGRGFLVMPMKDPMAWEACDREAIQSRLGHLMSSDYRQTKGVATLIG